MTRWSAASCILTALAAIACGAPELPKSEEADSFEIEPPLLMQNRPVDPLPATETKTDAPVATMEDLEKALERAKRSAKSAERLVRIGALARAEAEQRALRVVRLSSDLANARLARAKEELAQLATAESSKADLAKAEAAVAEASEAARDAASVRDREELAAAELSVLRQQKLLALGSGRKSEVSRAEQRLAELKALKN